ncbi:MAG TPA: translation initiation factor IF-2 N-terminal domain-containing protein, partial [Thermoleophilaceae bacterium]|nr:translation initiation factor IF-2 N-terminal domain-containing protein [Thermoleophilaceae bacterium]
MAKKRVHEIAKERGISSKDVLSTLQAAGLEVKAAASSVDEDDIRRAFEGGGSGNGAAAGDEAATGRTAEDGEGAPSQA